MIEVTIDIAAAPARVWATIVDVLRWPEWTPTVTAVRPLGAPGPLAVGDRFFVEQPKLRPAEWTVTAVEAGRSFVWAAQAGGVRTEAVHEVTPTEGGCRVRLTVTFGGPMGWLASWLAGSLTRAYVQQEAEGLKRRVEG